VLSLLGIPAFSLLLLTTAFQANARGGDLPWTQVLVMVVWPASLFVVWLYGAIALVAAGRGGESVPLFAVLFIFGFVFYIICATFQLPYPNTVRPLSTLYIAYSLCIIGLNVGMLLSVRWLVLQRGHGEMA